MPKRWPKELKESIVEMMRSGMGADDIRQLFEGKDKVCPPIATIRRWAHEAGVSSAIERKPARDRSNGRARARKPPAPLIKAADLPVDVRDRLEGFFEKGLDYLNSGAAIKDARNTKALTDSMANLLSLAPDLLTYKDKLSDGGSTDSGADSARVLQAMGLPTGSPEE